MGHFLVHASMLDHASTGEQRDLLRERLGDARIRHNSDTGVLIAQFEVDSDDRDDACLEAMQKLRTALTATRLSPTILMVGTATAC